MTENRGHLLSLRKGVAYVFDTDADPKESSGFNSKFLTSKNNTTHCIEETDLLLIISPTTRTRRHQRKAANAKVTPQNTPANNMR